MNKEWTAVTTLGEWLEHPPTIVIYRPDGQVSLDVLPGMTTPDAIVCFRSMAEAQQLLGSCRRLHRKAVKGFQPVELPLEQWLGVIKAEADKGRTHLAIFQLPGEGQLEKVSIRIADLFDTLEKAGAEYHRLSEPWRWN